MTRTKFLIMSLLVGIILLIMPTMVNATVLDNSTITVTTSKYSSDGSISVELSGLTLDLTHSYQYSLVKNVSETPTKWIDLVSPTETTANCVLSATTTEIKEVLKVANTGYLFIKDLNDVDDDTDDTNVVEKLSINLKLPFHEAIDIKYSEGRQVSFDRLYGIGKASYQFVKITDEDIIDTYLSNNRDTSSILSMLPTTAPVNGWNEMSLYGSSPHAYSYDSTAGNNSGLYLIWGQMYGDSCRTIYGYTVYDNLPIDEEGPTVSKIEVTSPTKSGIYETDQVIKITVYFNENITGTTVPTLKIRFGTSEERTVTNGTISENEIVYTYTIVDSDVGQLAVIGYSGGTIKDASGNDATISSKTIGGYTIKANVDDGSDSSSQTPGTDDTNDESNDNGTTNNESTNTENTNNGNTSSDKKEDSTTATGKLPQTGLTMGMTLAILAVLAGGVFAYFKYSKLRGI